MSKGLAYSHTSHIIQLKYGGYFPNNDVNLVLAGTFFAWLQYLIFLPMSEHALIKQHDNSVLLCKNRKNTPKIIVTPITVLLTNKGSQH